MSAITFATKKLWIRRWNRFGKRLFLPVLIVVSFTITLVKWFIALATTYFRVFKQNPSGTIAITFTVCMFLGIIAMAPLGIYYEMIGKNPVSAEEIIELRRSDSCIDYTLPRRVKAKDVAIVTLDDVRSVKKDCAVFWEQQRIKQEQASALK